MHERSRQNQGHKREPLGKRPWALIGLKIPFMVFEVRGRSGLREAREESSEFQQLGSRVSGLRLAALNTTQQGSR